MHHILKHINLRHRALSVMILVFCVMGIFAYFDQWTQYKANTDARQYIEAHWNTCERFLGNRTEWNSCWKKPLFTAIHDFGLRTVLLVAEEEYNRSDNADSGGISRCHDFAHQAGESAVRLLRDPETAFAQCTPMCGYGCYMGVVDGTLTPDFFDTEYTHLCRVSPEIYPCIHALGHAIGNRLASVVKGQQYCAKFSQDAERQHCMSGLLMERFEASSFGHETEPIPEDPLGFCMSLDPLVRKVCYWRSGMLTYWRTRSYDLAIRTCNVVPDFERLGCISVLGQEMYFEHKGNAEKIVGFCELFTDTVDTRICIEGALTKSVMSDALLRHGLAICNEVEAGEQNACNQFLRTFQPPQP